MLLVEKIGTSYRIAEGETLGTVYHEKIEQFLLRSITERLEEYLVVVDKEFPRKKIPEERRQQSG